jgi:Flp pilus assembly pilin Flp
MFVLLRRLIAEEKAQDLAEYGIALAVIGAVGGFAAAAISGSVSTLWSNAQSIIQSSV